MSTFVQTKYSININRKIQIYLLKCEYLQKEKFQSIKSFIELFVRLFRFFFEWIWMELFRVCCPVKDCSHRHICVWYLQYTLWQHINIVLPQIYFRFKIVWDDGEKKKHISFSSHFTHLFYQFLWAFFSVFWFVTMCKWLIQQKFQLFVEYVSYVKRLPTSHLVDLYIHITQLNMRLWDL